MEHSRVKYSCLLQILRLSSSLSINIKAFTTIVFKSYIILLVVDIPVTNRWVSNDSLNRIDLQF